MVVSAAILAMPARAEDEVLLQYENDGWAPFKPGSWITTETTVVSGGKSTRTAEKITLLRMDGGQQDFRVETTINGVTEKQDNPVTLPEPWKVTWTEVGKETLEIEGVKIECRILERKHTKSDGETRSWRGQVDGKEIELKERAVIRRPDGSVETNSTDVVKLKEKVKIGDREVTCRVSVNTFEKKKGDESLSKDTTRRWDCPSVPGGTAKVEQVVEDGKSRTTTTWAVTAFEAAKSE